MFGKHQECCRCEKMASIDMNGRYYCSEHALEHVRAQEHIPARMRLVK